MTDAGGATTAGLYDSDVLEWSEQQARLLRARLLQR